MLIKRMIYILAACFILSGINVAADNSEKTLIYAMNSHLVSADGSIMDILPKPFVCKSQSYVPVMFTIAILGGEAIHDTENNSISVLFNGKTLNRTLSDGLYQYNAVYLPARDLAELLGISIAWADGILVMSTGNAANYSQHAEEYKTTLSYTWHYDTQYRLLVYAMNSHLALANGDVMDILPNPFIYKSQCFVPVFYTLAVLGVEAVYDEANNSLHMTYDGKEYTRTMNDCMYEYDVAYLPASEIAKLSGISIMWDNGILVMYTGENVGQFSKYTEKYKGLLSYTGHYDVFDEREYQKLEKVVTFSASSGSYNEPFALELSTNLRSGVIRYTTDGSIPTDESPVYTGPIQIYDRTYEENVAANVQHVVNGGFKYPTGPVIKGTVISAKAFNNEGDSTKTCINTYFVGINLAEHYRVKVISLTAPFESLFDPENGIYTHLNSMQLSNWKECAAYMEIFDKRNACVVSQPIGLRLNGAGSRVLQQKSLRVYARQNEEYINGDKKSIKYDLFDGKVTDINLETVTKYKRFILRNGGDDWKNFFMKDATIQALCAPFDVDRQASEDSVVFVNGEFFGYYRLRERYDDEYFQYHYKLNNEKDAVIVQISSDPFLATLSEGLDEDLEDFNSKIYYVINNDMSNPDSYAAASSYFNTGSLIDYYIVNIFFENLDWPYNNVKLWRNKNPENGDTRYRFMLSDGDTSMNDIGSVFANNYGPESDLALKWKGTRSTGTLGYKLDDVDCLMNNAFNSFMKNENFKIEFIRRYNDYLNTVLTTWNLDRYIHRYYYDPIDLRDEQLARYPESWSKSDTADLDVWAGNRPSKARKELENYFGYKTKVSVTFKADPAAGYICANSIELRDGTRFELNSPFDYTAKYYKDFPLWFRAVANEGYELDYFIVNGEPWRDGSEYVFNPQKKTTIEAVFKAKG